MELLFTRSVHAYLLHLRTMRKVDMEIPNANNTRALEIWLEALRRQAKVFLTHLYRGGEMTGTIRDTKHDT